MEVHLVVVKGNPRGRILSFGPGEFLIGRGHECQVRPDSEWVSRQHCQLVVSKDTIQLRDLGSTNGTLINGERLVGERLLVHGDTIQIGPLSLQVRVPDHDTESLKQTDPAATDITVSSGEFDVLVETVHMPWRKKLDASE